MAQKIGKKTCLFLNFWSIFFVEFLTFDDLNYLREANNNFYRRRLLIQSLYHVKKRN